ncbi:class I SAM-dependent DNA methyltransferase [Terrabacter sp. GCM10028922]|uniref:class I SAM-dependent DNA methyltransferase n=1 Tax=Terrabacter sp. GCM10028922 TaxID=3273428 RepID=UPI00362176C2
MTAYPTDDLVPSPFDEKVAPTYDAGSAHMFDPAVLGPTVDVLHELAGSGPALELAIGTGRVALPLHERGVEVHGIDFSEAMVAELRSKPGGDRLQVVVGDMTTTRVGSGYRVAYLVYNTITNLLTQDDQVECFRTVAEQLAPGGSFVVEGLRPAAASAATRAEGGAVPRGGAARRLRHHRRRLAALGVAPLRPDRT